MTNKQAQKKIESLQKKIDKLVPKLKEQINTICESLDYKNSSAFSYNIDRLEQFNNELQNFKIQ